MSEKISDSSRTETWADQIERIRRELAQKYPELCPADQERQKVLEERRDLLEGKVADTELSSLLRDFGCKDFAVEEVSEDLYAFDLPGFHKDETLRSLPGGYGYKGGAARALLMRILGVDTTYVPRDFDIIRLTDDEPYQGADVDVAKQYMANDFEYGHGVEVIHDENIYFESRDLTINEVYATKDRVVATRQCIADTLRGVIRPTYNLLHCEGLRGGNLAKIIRFYAEAIERYDEATIEDLPVYALEPSSIYPFYLALNLDKAYEKSPRIAREFVAQLKKIKQLPGDIRDTEDAASYLLSVMTNHNFYFRHVPVSEISQEYERFGVAYEDAPTQQSMAA